MCRIKYFVNVKYACLLNIVSKKMIIPEIVNSSLSKNDLSKAKTKKTTGLFSFKNFEVQIYV